MSENYDKWESSDHVSSSSSSHLDEYGSFVPISSDQLPMNHSELRQLTHSEWKTMLPHGKTQVVWRSSSLGFFLDQRTGKNCFMLGATKLTISWKRFDRKWEMKSHPKSRFSEVAELMHSSTFVVRGRINTQMLSPDTFYAPYLVFGFDDSNKNLESSFSMIRFLYDRSDYVQPKMVLCEPGKCRDDGWMEIKLGDFYVGLGEKGEVEAQLVELSGYMKNGLIVEGMEFRPSADKTNTI